jgi:hyperosmotically inducible protein
MRELWPRLASLALAALLALAVGGVMTAHARTVGEFIDDARIAAEVIAKLTADSPSNFLKINVKSESGIVTLSGTVDSADKRARAAQIASAVNGVKGLVSNIQLAGGGAPTPPTANVPPSPIGTSAIDATGTIASVDSSTGTITLTDGRVLPMPAASASTTAPSPGPTQTTPVPTSPTPRTPSATTNVFDATDVSVVWTPSASANR